MIGTTLAQFEITSKLGEGGMGEVWLARDTKVGREVALKVLPADVAGDAERLARFEREAKVLASLNHPNIATLFGLETVSSRHPERAERVEGSPDGRSDAPASAARPSSGDPSTRSSDSLAQDDIRTFTLLVMELVAGEDLSERISRGPVPASPLAIPFVTASLLPVCDAARSLCLCCGSPPWSNRSCAVREDLGAAADRRRHPTFPAGRGVDPQWTSARRSTGCGWKNRRPP